ATPRPLPTANLQSFTPPAASSGEGQTWLVMLYQDADDKVLEQDIYVDLNEAERVGSNERMHIVAQVDRYRAGYQGDGNWATAKRFYVTQDDDLQRVASEQIADLGEVNMADGETLIDFVTWAIETFPADKHVLILSDHGMGWPGGWSDPDPSVPGDASTPLGAALGNQLYLNELDEALTEIRSRSGLEAFELIGLDACLMGHLEVFSALAPHARYAVASQEIEPALGWAYTGFLQELAANPNVDGVTLSQHIVQSYIQEDQRIVDDQARAEFVGRGSPVGGLFGLFGAAPAPSADQLARQLEQNITLTAIDLSALPALVSSVNDFSFALQELDQRTVAQARSYAQSFTSVFGNNIPPSYIDLGNFVELLKREGRSPALAQPADRVLAALDRAVIAEKHGPKKPGSTGVSIYFPNSQLYQIPQTGPQSYTGIANRFATESLWDDFLAFHYTGRAFEPATNTVAIPEAGARVSGPGAGPIQVSPITLSGDVAAPSQPVLLSVDITGDNVGYIYLFVGFYDQASNAIFVADSDYLESDETREVEGVYYPVWSQQDEFTMEFEWEPVVFAIDDGANRVVARFEPQSYGATFEEAIYTVDGLYTFADGGETRYARLYFNDGRLRQIFGFTGEDFTGAPREITPQTGDTFTVLERWLDLDQQGNVAQASQQTGDTLTFGEQPFTWQELDAAPGRYLVGFIVEDLDGNTTEVFEEVTVN
ncbi:MAG TPA: clostripain-related cysteine peptidase, partial [Anaerolineae bacterium]|nr:clostripain-related cysteine peptidase [Anaerolineae bacterium]